MRRGGRLLVVFGIVLGLLSAVGVFGVLNSAQPSAQAVATKSVVVALQNIPGRSEIIPDAIGKADWPDALVPPGAFDTSADVVGKMSLEVIYPGQIILAPMIVDKSKVKDTKSNAAFLIPDGKIAVAFPLTLLGGVAGALQAGDYVDFLLTLTTPKDTTIAPAALRPAGSQIDLSGGPISQQMLQDVLILQVGNWPTGTPADKNAAATGIITVVVDRQDALALKSAREQGVIELILRKAGDHKLVQTEPVTLQYLDKRFNFKLATGGK